MCLLSSLLYLVILSLKKRHASKSEALLNVTRQTSTYYVQYHCEQFYLSQLSLPSPGTISVLIRPWTCITVVVSYASLCHKNRICRHSYHLWHHKIVDLQKCSGFKQELLCSVTFCSTKCTKWTVT